MMDKIELQSVGMAHNQEALERERKLNDLRTSLEASGTSPLSQAQILDLQARNDVLTTEVASLNDKLKKARAFIKNQDALFRAEHDKKLSTGFTQQSQDFENKIAALKNELSVAKVGPAATGGRRMRRCHDSANPSTMRSQSTAGTASSSSSCWRRGTTWVRASCATMLVPRACGAPLPSVRQGHLGSRASASTRTTPCSPGDAKG